MQRPVKWAVHCVNRMRPLDGFAAPFRCDQPHSHVDPPDNQHTIFALSLPGNIGGEFAIAGVDLARFQRASKRAHHSAGGRGDHVVDGGTVRALQFRRVDFVMLGNGPVYAENHGLRFARQLSNTKRTLAAFDSRL